MAGWGSFLSRGLLYPLSLTSWEEAENRGHWLQPLLPPSTHGKGGYAAAQTWGAWILNPLGLSLRD